MNVEFVDELPPAKSWTTTQDFVEALRERPGEWAIYPQVARSTMRTYMIRNRKVFPGTEWAVRDGRLYGRWVGDE